MVLAFLSLRKLWQGIRRHPLRWGGATVLAGFVALGIGLHVLALFHYRAARAALDERDLQAARGNLQLCLQVWPLSTDTLLLAARIERLDNNFRKAEDYLNQLKQFQSGVTDKTQLEWTLLRASAGDLGEAEPGLWNAVKAGGPEAPYILENLAECYKRRNRFSNALAALNQWLELEKDNPLALEWRAQILTPVNGADARKDYEKMVQVAPARWKGRLGLVFVLLEGNNGAEALKHLDILRVDHAGDPDVMLGMARCAFVLNHLSEARQAFDQLLEQEPNFGEAMYQRARLELQDRHPHDAEIWVRKALALEPFRTELHYLFYRTLKNQPGREKEAEAQLQRHEQVVEDSQLIKKLIDSHAGKEINDPQINSQIGAAYLRLGLDKNGLSWLERALRRDPRHKETHEILAHYYQEHQQPELAAKHQRLAQ